MSAKNRSSHSDQLGIAVFDPAEVGGRFQFKEGIYHG
jgi:hypothetical protein